jgi:energy-coupling factor transporter ATP-binding protein EcfA2
MLIRELGIENFRKFRQPVRLAGFGDGLNLVCAPNEAGKSTILEALRAVLFERHGAKGQRIRSFRPHGDEVAPTIELLFEVAGQTWSLRKRFLQAPSVMLEGRAERYQSDEAEEKLQSLLGFARAGNAGADDDSRGALGLLWVEQGQSFVLGAPGQSARRTLEDVLANEVGAVTGGRRTSAVVQAVDKSLAELQTATGKPTKRLAEGQERTKAAQAAAIAAQTELVQFEETLSRLDAKRGELRRVMRDLEDEEQHSLVVQINQDIERAKAAAQTLRSAELALRQAVGGRERVEERVTQRQTDRAALAKATADSKLHAQTLAEQGGALEEARKAEAEAVRDVAAAREAVAAAEVERGKALKGRLGAEQSRAALSAFARLERAEALAAEMQRLNALVEAERMTHAAASRLDALDREALEARSVVEAGAAMLDVRLEPGVAGVFLDGDAIQGEHKFTVSAPRELAVSGVGRFTIIPPASGETALARLRAAERDLADCLKTVGHPSAAEARLAARRRDDQAREAEALAARLISECPADAVLQITPGLEALRAALAGTLPPAPEALDLAQLQSAADQAEAQYQQARTMEEQAVGRREAALNALQKAQLSEVKLAGLANQAAAEVDRLSQLLAAAQTSDEDLAAGLVEAKTVEARASVDHDSAKRACEGLDLAALERRRETAERRRQRLNDDRLELVGVLARLEEQAKTLGGAGPATRAQAADELAQAAQQDLERLSEEAEVLALLRHTLEAAQSDASRKYLTPITLRVEPYVRRLLPNASLSFGEDFRPHALTRSGREELADDLSKGTQEQLAVLTRLAFADLLLAKGKPASLVLDDALVFADDARFETMTEILAEAGQRMQVIVLSCHASAYRHVEATRLVLT